MKITNDIGLPKPLMRALEVPEEKFDDKTIRVTELIGPALVRRLRRKYGHKLVVKASDQIWSLYGTIGHGILHKYTDPGEVAEKRITVDCMGIRLTGRFDLLAGDHITDTLVDWKFVTVWSLKDDETGKWTGRKEWTWQMNIYRYLLYKETDKLVSKLNIVALLRDWSKLEALRQGKSGGYPESQVVTLDIPVFPLDQIESYIKGRIEDHTQELPICSKEERWAKPDCWKVKKKGNQRAMPGAVYNNPADAKFRVDEMTKKGVECVIEHIPGRSVRCESYCDVAPFCAFGREVLNFSNEEP